MIFMNKVLKGMKNKLYISETKLRNIIRYVLNEMRAYHGSGAKFSKFSSDFNGSGEGSASFGPGHYFTNSKQIAQDYANEHGTSKEEVGKFSFCGYTSPSEVIQMIRSNLCNCYKDWESVYEKLLPIAQKMYEESETSDQLIRKLILYKVNFWKQNDPDYEKDYEEYYKYNIERLRDNLKKDIKDVNYRTLYQVEIPEGDKYADWNMEVPKKWYDFISSVLDMSEDTQKYFEPLNRNINSYIERDGELTVGTLYYSLNNMHYDASFGINLFKNLLKRFGYVGVKYPSGQNFQTSSTKQGDMNYTVFDDNNVKVTNRWDY